MNAALAMLAAALLLAAGAGWRYAGEMRVRGVQIEYLAGRLDALSGELIERDRRIKAQEALLRQAQAWMAQTRRALPPP